MRLPQLGCLKLRADYHLKARTYLMQKNFWTLQTLELVAAVVVLGVLDEVVHGSEGLPASLTHRHRYGTLLGFEFLFTPETGVLNYG